MKLKTFLTAALAVCMAASGFSQTDRAKWTEDGKYLYPYWFITVQGGAHTQFTNYPARKLFTPIGAVSVGRMFSSTVGARLNASGWNTKGGIKNIGKYNYRYVAYDADVLVSLTNILSPNKYNPLQAYLIGGVGLVQGWHNGEMVSIAESGAYNAPYAWGNRLFHNFRAGAMLEYNINRFIAFNLEVTADNRGDHYNSKINGHGDWTLNGLFGLTVKFGHKKAPAPVVEKPAPKPVVVEQPKPEPKPVVVEKPKPAPVVEQPKPKVLEDDRQEIFFNRGKSIVRDDQMGKVERLAKWMKEHPSATITLDSYADVQTGNAQINQRLSNERVENVKKLLIEKFGIDASRFVRASSHGDKVQPFADNDKNRAVITYAKETE